MFLNAKMLDKLWNFMYKFVNAGGERSLDFKCLMAHAETLPEEEFTSFFLATKTIATKQEIQRLEHDVFCKFYKEQ